MQSVFRDEAARLVAAACPWVSNDSPDELKFGKSFVYRCRSTTSAPSVIAKCAPHISLLNEHRTYEFLSQLPVFSLRSFGLFESSNPDYSWLLIEDASGQSFDASDPVHRRAFGQWLADMHLATANHRELKTLPERAVNYYLDIVTATLSTLGETQENPELGNHERDIVANLFDQVHRVNEKWDLIVNVIEQMPSVLCHNGIAGKNIHVITDSEVRIGAFDWEASGRGPAVADLFCADLATYQSRITSAFPQLATEGTLEGLAEVGRIIWNLAPIPGEHQNLIGLWPQRAIGKLEYYATQIECGLDELERRQL